MRIFVTGATGVIGRRVLPLLVRAGHGVTAVGRSAEKLATLERMGVSPVRVNLFDPTAVRKAVTGQDVVINLATHIPPSSMRMFLPSAWRENDRIRRDASRILADTTIAEGVQRLVQESFAPIYSDGGEAWIDEHSPISPARYNRSIVDAERSAERFTASGRTGIVLRFAAFYGPDSIHVLDLIKFIRKGWAPLPGSPRAFLSSISHDDAATAIVAALSIPAGIYNVTDDAPVRRREFVDSLAASLGVSAPKFPPAWFGRLGGALAETLARSLRISNRKLRTASNWAPRYPSVREGWPAVVGALPRL